MTPSARARKLHTRDRRPLNVVRPRPRPTLPPVEGFHDGLRGQFNAVTAGGGRSCGLRTDGTITCWGWNEDRQAEAPGGQFSAVTGGGGRSCGLRTDGTITCWGSWAIRTA